MTENRQRYSSHIKHDRKELDRDCPPPSSNHGLFDGKTKKCMFFPSTACFSGEGDKKSLIDRRRYSELNYGYSRQVALSVS